MCGGVGVGGCHTLPIHPYIYLGRPCIWTVVNGKVITWMSRCLWYAS